MVKGTIFLILSIVLSYGNCKLKSSEVSDGPCNRCPPVAENANLTYVLTPREYYVPLGTKHFYRNLAEVLLGRPAKNENELNQMDIKFLWGKEFSAYKGYNRIVNVSCEADPSPCPPAPTRVICTPTTSTCGTNTSSISEFTATLVYTDNASSLMVVRCLLDDESKNATRDYAVFSPNPSLSNPVLSACLSTADDLNFKRSHAQTYNYDSS